MRAIIFYSSAIKFSSAKKCLLTRYRLYSYSKFLYINKSVHINIQEVLQRDNR